LQSFHDSTVAENKALREENARLRAEIKVWYWHCPGTTTRLSEQYSQEMKRDQGQDGDMKG